MKGLPGSLVNRRVDEMLEIVQMEEAADRKLPTYSGGMKQRIVSATRPHEAAVVIDPSLEEAYLLATGKQAIRV